MTPKNRKLLSDRVVRAAEAALTAKHYATAIDVLIGIGWLDQASVDRWRQGQIICLERAVQSNLSHISEAMKLFRSWAARKGLLPRETHYVSRRRRWTLRFSKSGKPEIEQSYRTHWVSPKLSEEKRARRQSAHTTALRGEAGMSEAEDRASERSP